MTVSNLIISAMSDEILMKYRKQEAQIREMAEDSKRKEQQLRMAALNLQSLLNNSRSSDKS
jgi:biotin synthase-related radical SAM superfamily protein